MDEPIENITDELSNILDYIVKIFTTTLFEINENPFTLTSIILFIISVALLVFLSGKFNKLLVNRILARYDLDIGIRQSIGTIIRYIILVLGMIIIVQASGINLSTLTVLAGALGVGIGFGLQNVADNFISGLIILFERPIKVGDRIEVGEINGDVIKISARATTVLTNDNISIIVPNSEFISSRVINWSHNDRRVRFRFPVGVSYNEDPDKVRKVILEVLQSNNGVLKDPPPDVWFEEFGDSSLNFNLMVWTSQYVQRPRNLKSQLYYEIFRKFREHNIEIPFPQRDLHIKSGILSVKNHSNSAS